MDETRGLIATYAGEPINAYTSTLAVAQQTLKKSLTGVPYLRGRECAAEGVPHLLLS